MNDRPVNDVATARRALACVDLTDLDDGCTAEAVDELCRRATGRHGHTAAVCVWPRFVVQAAATLRGTGVRVATVVNFPAGGTDADVTVAEAADALVHGADEIDLVLPYHAFLDGRPDVAAAMIDAVRAIVGSPHRLKVILETGSYPDLSAVDRAARLAIEHGADFIKTSTGKTSASASPDATRTMLLAIRDTRTVIGGIGRTVGIKPSGGIRTAADAAIYLAIADEIMGPEWANPATFRFGASGLLDALEAVIAGDESGAVANDAAY